MSFRRKVLPPYGMVAAIPFLFAIQQAAEGVVWLTTPRSSDTEIQRIAATIFLSCALIVWPVWLSFALKRVERVPERRRILGALGWAGVVVAVTASALLARRPPEVAIAGHSIHYDRAGGGSSAALNALLILIYIVPTVVPFFVSTMRLARTIGATLIISLIVTAFAERDALTSVWCFFAALLSVLIVLSLQAEHKIGRSLAG